MINEVLDDISSQLSKKLSGIADIVSDDHPFNEDDFERYERATIFPHFDKMTATSIRSYKMLLGVSVLSPHLKGLYMLIDIVIEVLSGYRPKIGGVSSLVLEEGGDSLVKFTDQWLSGLNFSVMVTKD